MKKEITKMSVVNQKEIDGKAVFEFAESRVCFKTDFGYTAKFHYKVVWEEGKFIPKMITKWLVHFDQEGDEWSRNVKTLRKGTQYWENLIWSFHKARKEV